MIDKRLKFKRMKTDKRADPSLRVEFTHFFDGLKLRTLLQCKPVKILILHSIDQRHGLVVKSVHSPWKLVDWVLFSVGSNQKL